MWWHGSQCCSHDDRTSPTSSFLQPFVCFFVCLVLFSAGTDTSISLHHFSGLCLRMISGLLAGTVLSVWICWSYRTVHEPTVVTGLVVLLPLSHFLYFLTTICFVLFSTPFFVIFSSVCMTWAKTARDSTYIPGFYPSTFLLWKIWSYVSEKHNTQGGIEKNKIQTMDSRLK